MDLDLDGDPDPMGTAPLPGLITPASTAGGMISTAGEGAPLGGSGESVGEFVT
jgi:hypothetical protein